RRRQGRNEETRHPHGSLRDLGSSLRRTAGRAGRWGPGTESSKHALGWYHFVRVLAPSARVAGRRPSVKIRSVAFDNRRQSFHVTAGTRTYELPYAAIDRRRDRRKVVRAFPDPQLGREAFTFETDTG